MIVARKSLKQKSRGISPLHDCYDSLERVFLVCFLTTSVVDDALQDGHLYMKLATMVTTTLRNIFLRAEPMLIRKVSRMIIHCMML